MINDKENRYIKPDMGYFLGDYFSTGRVDNPSSSPTLEEHSWQGAKEL
jgi:hypothetical protein